MSRLTIVFLIVSAFVLIPGAVMAVRSFLQNRAEDILLFRNYFGPGYDRDLVKQSSWCDEENLKGLRTRLVVKVREKSATRRNRNRD